MKTEHAQRLAALYASMYDVLYQKTMLRYRDPDFAEDVIHETFAIACAECQQLLKHPCPEGWLLVTARHVAERKHRLRDYHVLPLDDAEQIPSSRPDDPADLLEPDVLYADLAQTKEFQLVRELTEGQLTQGEAAAKRGITQVAYRKRIQRAKKSLAEKISNKK
jgi:DNA-directed RNA polymerase specialized sigma24 family protein